MRDLNTEATYVCTTLTELTTKNDSKTDELNLIEHGLQVELHGGRAGRGARRLGRAGASPREEPRTRRPVRSRRELPQRSLTPANGWSPGGACEAGDGQNGQIRGATVGSGGWGGRRRGLGGRAGSFELVGVVHGVGVS